VAFGTKFKANEMYVGSTRATESMSLHVPDKAKTFESVQRQSGMRKSAAEGLADKQRAVAVRNAKHRAAIGIPPRAPNQPSLTSQQATKRKKQIQRVNRREAKRQSIQEMSHLEKNAELLQGTAQAAGIKQAKQTATMDREPVQSAPKQRARQDNEMGFGMGR
jgi:hypothetical protein